MMLAASLKKLMMVKPLHAITVKEITDACGLHRQTFYYHFSDVYGLMCWMFEEETCSFFKEADRTACWQERLLQLFDYLDRNRTLCLSAYRSLGRETLRDLFGTDLEEIVREVIFEYGRDVPEIEADVEFLTIFYVGALGGIVERWIQGEICRTPEEIVAMTGKMAAAQLAGAMVLRDEREVK
jgi:probable dihydroxyacetone kinase regulator